MNLLNKIEISNFTYLFLLISFLSGYFNYIFILLLFIIIHELGHLLAGSFLKFKIDKIIIYPFGGITKFNNLLNTNISEEMIVCIGGPLIQFLFYIFIYFIYKNGLISIYNFEKVKTINYALLMFNLLPIIPLDGSKLLNLFLDKYFAYKLSNKLTIYVSIFLIIIISLLNKKIFYTIIVLLLLKSVYEEIKIVNYKFNKFLLERYLYDFKFKNYKIIKNINKIKKEKYHVIKYKNKYIKEKDYLRKMFD